MSRSRETCIHSGLSCVTSGRNRLSVTTAASVANVISNHRDASVDTRRCSRHAASATPP